MEFSTIFHDHIQTSFARILQEHIQPKVTIEIGAFEGQTTVNMVNYMKQIHPDYQHYVIDPFTASENLKQDVLDNAKDMFLRNVQDLKAVNFINKDSFSGLIELLNAEVRADFIYVDGSHFAKDVLSDAVLGFELLEVGGVILFDDAVSWRYGNAIQDSPKIAIDSFINCNWDRLEVIELPNGYQVAIKKTKE